MLREYALRRSGKHGGDAEMFESLKQGHVRAAKVRRRRRYILSALAAAAAILVAVLVPLAVSAEKDPVIEHQRIDGLIVTEVTREQLSGLSGVSLIIPDLDGYDIKAYKTFTDDDGAIKAYSFELSAKAVDALTGKIEIRCVLDSEFIFSLEKIIIDKGQNAVCNGIGIRTYIKDSISSTKFVFDIKYLTVIEEHDDGILLEIIEVFDI